MSHQTLPFGGGQIALWVGLGIVASYCRSRVLHRCPLVVSKVDRLTRSVAFLSRLLEAGVDVRFCDLPQIEGDIGRFLLQQMVSVAELEAGMIGTRTRAALAAAKARGKALGGTRTRKSDGQRVVISRTAQKTGAAANRRRATDRAADLAPTIAHDLPPKKWTGLSCF
jgi:DNA invertase Pin-like site-specific DNA recombinase